MTRARSCSDTPIRHFRSTVSASCHFRFLLPPMFQAAHPSGPPAFLQSASFTLLSSLGILQLLGLYSLPISRQGLRLASCPSAASTAVAMSRFDGPCTFVLGGYLGLLRLASPESLGVCLAAPSFRQAPARFFYGLHFAPTLVSQAPLLVLP